MTRQTRESIQCPKCGKSQEVTIWSSLNVGLHPDLRESLFQGEINQFKCQGCGQGVFLNVPLMYHDMPRKFAVQYYPPQSLDDPQFIDLFEPENPPRLKRISKSMGHVAQPHIVFNMNDFLNCIVFHERIRKTRSAKQ